MSNSNDPRESVRYFVADIGGTNARFAIVGDMGLWHDRLTLPTSTFDLESKFEDQLADKLSRLLEAGPLAGACIAMAGPVIAGQGKLSNAGLTLNAVDLSRVFQCQTLLVNDFYALAHWIPVCEKKVFIGDGSCASGPKVVLGPGTGLGSAALFPRSDGGWEVVASESGHMDFAPHDPLELEIARVLQLEIPYLCWESLLSGPGLVSLYLALARVLGHEPKADATPEWITHNGFSADNKLCHQALNTFCVLLAGLAGNLALAFGATGGTYLTGGVVEGIRDYIATQSVSDLMRQRFEDRGILTDYIKPNALVMVCDEAPGISGAATLLRQGPSLTRQ